MDEHHRILTFVESDFLDEERTWSWQCLTCRAMKTGFPTPADAEASADEHGTRV